MIGTRQVTLQFNVPWLALILLIAAALISVYLYVDQPHKPTLVFIATVLGGVAALLAAINALDARVAQLEQTKKGVAIEFINRWVDPDLFPAKVSVRETLLKFKTLSNPHDQHTYLTEDPSRGSNLFGVLNFFEGLSIAIQVGIADDETVKRFFRSILTGYWHETEKVIQKRREDQNNARIFQDFEWLYEHWKN